MRNFFKIKCQLLILAVFDRFQPPPTHTTMLSLMILPKGWSSRLVFLCAHRPALFIPNQLLFISAPLPCARMEGCATKVTDMDFLCFDSMKRSEEGTMKWQWSLHTGLIGTGVLKWHQASPSGGHRGSGPSELESP